MTILFSEFTPNTMKRARGRTNGICRHDGKGEDIS